MKGESRIPPESIGRVGRQSISIIIAPLEIRRVPIRKNWVNKLLEKRDGRVWWRL